MSEQHALLALGIAEYQSANDALHALSRAGLGVRVGTLSRIRIEQRLLMMRWQRMHDRSPVVSTDNWAEIVSEVRAWITSHPVEANQVHTV